MLCLKQRPLTSNNTDSRHLSAHHVSLLWTTALASGDKPGINVDRGGAGQVDARCGQEEPGGARRSLTTRCPGENWWWWKTDQTSLRGEGGRRRWGKKEAKVRRNQEERRSEEGGGRVWWGLTANLPGEDPSSLISRLSPGTRDQLNTWWCANLGWGKLWLGSHFRFYELTRARLTSWESL